MKDIEILENMRDEIYGAMQFEDNYQVSELEEEQFNALNLAIKALKERQADKEKIKELGKDYAEMLIKLNAQNLNNSIEQIKRSNEQVEALNEAWKIELEKKGNRIKELESDKEIKDKMIDLMVNELVFGVFDFKSIKQAKQYFENLAKESGEIDEC